MLARPQHDLQSVDGVVRNRLLVRRLPRPGDVREADKPRPPLLHPRILRSQIVRTVEPVVLRAARSACAFAASFKGYVWCTSIFTAPDFTTSNSSLAMATRFSRLAA